MTFLLDRGGDDVKITKEVVKAAAGNPHCGKDVMTLLLDRLGDDVKITEEVVKAAYFSEDMMMFLRDLQGRMSNSQKRWSKLSHIIRIGKER
jgi:hypothetical protein